MRGTLTSISIFTVRGLGLSQESENSHTILRWWKSQCFEGGVSSSFLIALTNSTLQNWPCGPCRWWTCQLRSLTQTTVLCWLWHRWKMTFFLQRKKHVNVLYWWVYWLLMLTSHSSHTAAAVESVTVTRSRCVSKVQLGLFVNSAQVIVVKMNMVK